MNKVEQAIIDMEEMKLTHIHWAEYFEQNPEIETKYVESGEWDNAFEHRLIVEKYNNVISILKVVSNENAGRSS